jgi:hypothetical protein
MPRYAAFITHSIRAKKIGFKFQVSGFMISGFRFQVAGAGFRVSGSGCAGRNSRSNRSNRALLNSAFANGRQLKRIHVCCVELTPLVIDGHRHPGMLLAGVQGPDKTWIPAKNMPE